jgi:CTP:molybdopterin cytidylyltransferase MocA
MEIIVPAAGLSTRFPNMKPKYLLRDSDGVMMIRKAISPYLMNHITIGILQKHVEEYDALNELAAEFGNTVEFFIFN